MSLSPQIARSLALAKVFEDFRSLLEPDPLLRRQVQTFRQTLSDAVQRRHPEMKVVLGDPLQRNTSIRPRG